jgi:feruloyl-CoA synthase
VVIAGHDHGFVSALIFPNLTGCRALCPDLDPGVPLRRLLDDSRVRRRFHEVLAGLARQSTGSSTFVARAILLDMPPSIDAREITDKGSLNQQSILRNRSAMVDELYEAAASPRVIAVDPGADH